MANNNVVVIYDKLESAVKKLEQYYTMLEEQQKMIARLDTYFDHLYKVHGKKNTFTSTMEDDIQSMAAAIKTDMADIDYLKNLTSYIIQSYTDAEGNTTTRSHALLMSALGSIVPAGAGATATIYSNMNEYSTAINQDSSRQADTSQYGDTKWVTYAETNATTADAWDAVHENSSINKESHAYKISETGTKISSKAESVVVKDMEKDVEEAQEKVKKAEEELAAKEKEMQETAEKAKEAEAQAQEAESKAQEAEQKAKAAESEAKEAKAAPQEEKHESSSSGGGSSQQKQEATKPETNNNETKTETNPSESKPSDSSSSSGSSLVDDHTSTETGTETTPTPDTEPDSESGVIIEPEETGTEEDLPDPTPKKSSSGSSKVIPIVAGLSAAGAAGVGAKIILDKKSDKDIDDEWNDNEGYIADEFIEGNQTDENQYLDSSDEFTFNTDSEPLEDDQFIDDNLDDVTEEEEVQGYQAIDFNDITVTH